MTDTTRKLATIVALDVAGYVNGRFAKLHREHDASHLSPGAHKPHA
jgi:hypothetical protein